MSRRTAETEDIMKLEETIQREIMEQRIEAGLEDLSQRLFGKTLEETTDEETYVVLLSQSGHL